jgi:arylsulfatase A-like enzyme
MAGWRPRALTVTVVVLAALGAAVPSASARGHAVPPARPNVVFVLADDMSASDLAVMPRVRALVADRGMTFTQFLVSNTLCCPSRTTILSGRYSHDNGVHANGGTNGGFEAAHRVGAEASTVATWLQRAGYRTGMVGKYLNGYPNGAPPTYVPPGWDDWVSPTVGGNPYNEYDYTLNVNGMLEHHGRAPGDYGTRVYGRHAEQFVNESIAARHPFFLYLAPYAPHRPATPAPADARAFAGTRAPRTESYDETDISDKPLWLRDVPLLSPFVAAQVDALHRRRLASLQAVDRMVAHLVGTLARAGKLDDTYVIFTSDNGFHLGQHRLPAGKQTAFEEDVHVPFVLRGPGVPPGRSVAAFAGNVDIAPTVAALAGVGVPGDVDGRSLVPLLGGPTPSDWRRAFLLEHWTERGVGHQGNAPLEPDDQDVTDRPPNRHAGLTDHDRIPDYRGIRTDRYTYVEYATGERELYDRARDPAELDNEAARASPALVRELHEALRRLERCRGVECRRAEAVPVP